MHIHRVKIVADAAIPFLDGRLNPFADVLSLPAAEITREAVKDADALIIRTRTKCNAALLEGSSVKMIATATIGTDHIDLTWCRDNGIAVANAPGCNAPGVAQWVWSTILSLGYEADKTTVGVIGVGNVGTIVAEWGRGLGFRMRLNDPPHSKAGENPPFGRWTSLTDVLHSADIITLHTPLTRSGEFPTHHLIDEKRLRALRHGALVLNAARGGIVDEEALSALSASGRLNAVIDTWMDEPAINRAMLATSLLATPHIAGYSLEGKQRATRMALEAIGRFFGFTPDVSGLEPAYVPFTPTAEQILNSYSPADDSLRLFTSPENFEKLRSEYIYRHEPKPIR